MVGDWVYVTIIPEGDSMIEAIRPRKSILKRADQSGHAIGYVKTMQEQVMVANFDYVFILTSLNEDYSLNRIARYVSVTLEGGGIPVVILTKADLCPDVTPFLKETAALSDKVRVHAISTQAGLGLEALRPYFREGVTIALLGSSGVGKSTLVNRLLGRDIMKTSAIREKDGKGRHTTTSSSLFNFPGGGYVIDTPGIRSIGLSNGEDDMDGETLAKIFPGFFEGDLFTCKYSNCLHLKEPGCSVRAAVESGKLSWARYASYLRILNSRN